MQRVIVTIRRADESRLRDLEVPAEIDAGQLANMVAEALRWQSGKDGGKSASYTIEAHPLGRVIQPNETLAGAGVWDGSWLVFHPVAVAETNPVGAPEGARSSAPQYAPPPAPPPAPPATPYTYAAAPQPQPQFPPQVQAPQVMPAPAPPVPYPANNFPAQSNVPQMDAPAPIPPYTQPQPEPQPQPQVQAQPQFQPQPQPQAATPTVTGWRSLGLDLPSLPPVEQSPLPPQATAPQADKPKASSFVWKQVDE